MKILLSTIGLGLMLGHAGAAGAETLLERGAYLVEGPAGCGNCHTDKAPGAPNLGGWLIREDGWEAFAQNITPGGRVADWSDAELGRAIREGIRPDGSVIGPPMPIGLYRGLSDRDLEAIVAYIRTVPAHDGPTVDNTYPFPLPASYGAPVGSVPEVPRDDAVAYGAYLAGPVAHCTECHSLKNGRPDFETNFGGGGAEFHGPWGVSVAANITSGAAGIGKYTDAELKAMITEGKRPDDSPMFPPMGYGYYAKMTSADVDAVIAYLRTIPPLPAE